MSRHGGFLTHYGLRITAAIIATLPGSWNAPSMRASFSPYYSIDLQPHHQFPMAKYREVHAALVADGTLPGGGHSPEPAADELLCLAHTPDYVARFRSGDLTAQEERRLGFRWSPELVRRALYATGGTVLAAKLALQDGIAANLAGGSHHAFADHGEGYCAFNDLAVATRFVLQAGLARRVAIVDCDVHQGNGTAAILGDDRDVFTFSIHCESNYPSQKMPGSRDVGLRDGVGDEAYLAILERELETIHRTFRPDLVFFQAGVDPLAGDRLGRLSLTRTGLRLRDELVLGSGRAAGIPTVVVLGGGYGRRLEDTVAAHADTIRTAVRLAAVTCGSTRRPLTPCSISPAGSEDVPIVAIEQEAAGNPVF
jgi:acetoin utilization deacetylase AcuC-like enzyme